MPSSECVRFSRWFRWLAGTLVLLALLGAAQLGEKLAPSPARMAQAAQHFLGLLRPEQKAQVAFAFDHGERTAWHFVPLQDKDKQPTRKGLRLEQMNDLQRAAALALLQTALSETGMAKANTIMSLESLLQEQEKGRGPVRNPGWYFVSIFGSPGLTGKWSWRFEGHHLSINVTLDAGRIISLTPLVFAANPGEVKDGPRQGTRPLGSTLDLARTFVRTLSDEQKAKTLFAKHFPEVQGRTAAAKVDIPKGLSYAEMTVAQKDGLKRLLEAYLDNLALELAELERKRVESLGWDKLFFAYTGGLGPNDAATYRIQGPHLLVEFLNVQSDGAGNPNNHFHTSWRTLPSDFGSNGK